VVNKLPRFVRALNDQTPSQPKGRLLTGSVKGFPNVMRAPNLKLSQLLPDPVGDLDVN
jgi:hypothetical protein